MEEVRKEIEELPEEGVYLGEQAGQEPAPGPEGEEQGEEGPGGARGAAGEEGAAPGAGAAEEAPAAPAEEPEAREIEERRRKLRELIETYRDVSSFVRDLRDLGPEERALVHSIVERVIGPGERGEAAPPQPIVVEKPVVKEVEKPVPVAPPEVIEASKKAEAALERIGGVEARLSRLEEALERLAEVQRDVGAAVKAVLSHAAESSRLRDELERIRRELEELRRNRERQYMIIPRAEKLNPDGSVVREYDFHPALKALEKRTEFAVEKLGPALIQELRATRSDISSSINRLVTLVEAIITPELRRRAPRLVESIEESVRKLVGRLSPEERERELAELERKVSELEKQVSTGGEKK